MLDPSSVSVNIVTLSNQTLGQPLTLECRVSVENDIVSTIDIIWSNDDLILETVEGVIATNNSHVYIDTFNITRLSTEDNGRIYKCETIVSTSPLVAVSDYILVNVTGENHYKLMYMFYNMQICTWFLICI